ncbi:MAG: hypothetical protein KQH57_09605 [Actinomycetales bacterium]|nr:hypothetical protein [Actinomycetales bacterium]
MAETTTVRVRATTRDELNALAAERGSTVEAVIREALVLYRHELWRARAASDARDAAANAEDRAEVAAVLAELSD